MQADQRKTAHWPWSDRGVLWWVSTKRRWRWHSKTASVSNLVALSCVANIVRAPRRDNCKQPPHLSRNHWQHAFGGQQNAPAVLQSNVKHQSRCQRYQEVIRYVWKELQVLST